MSAGFDGGATLLLPGFSRAVLVCALTLGACLPAEGPDARAAASGQEIDGVGGQTAELRAGALEGFVWPGPDVAPAPRAAISLWEADRTRSVSFEEGMEAGLAGVLLVSAALLLRRSSVAA